MKATVLGLNLGVGPEGTQFQLDVVQVSFYILDLKVSFIAM